MGCCSRSVPVPVVLDGVPVPQYKTKGSAGVDLRSALRTPSYVAVGERVQIPTNLKMAIPEGFELQIRSRSGCAWNDGLVVLNQPGTIDSDYRGVIKVMLINLGNDSVRIEPGDRIAQGVLCPVYQADFIEVESLDETERGEGGFGSTGRA